MSNPPLSIGYLGLEKDDGYTVWTEIMNFNFYMFYYFISNSIAVQGYFSSLTFLKFENVSAN